jgi:hypothetical protein
MTPEERQQLQAYKQQRLAPWDTHRGIGSINYNNALLLVRSDVETIAGVLARSAVRWEQDVLGKTVMPSGANAIVFRLRGHAWTIVLGEPAHDVRAPLLLSRELHTEAIGYNVSDTCGSIAYRYSRHGESLEEFFAEDNGRNRPRRDTLSFFSNIRTVELKDIKDIWGFTDTFLRDRDAYEPGLAYDYFFQEQSVTSHPQLILPGEPPDQNRLTQPITNAGIVIQFPDGEQVRSIPDIKRIDFVVFRDPPKQLGRLLLG